MQEARGEHGGVLHACESSRTDGDGDGTSELKYSLTIAGRILDPVNSRKHLPRRDTKLPISLHVVCRTGSHGR